MKRWISLSLLFLLSGCYFVQRPDMSVYEKYTHRKDPYQEVARQKVDVTFLGTTTLYFNDGETGIMIDGFFTRPGDYGQLAFGAIETDRKRVTDYLQRLQIKKLAAIPVFHSHHDHAMDSAEVARQTGAIVMGSESTAMIARGDNLPEEQILVVEEGKAYQYGKFKITMIRGKHVPLPGLIEATGMMDDVTEPLKQPTPFYHFREGITYSILIEHPLGTSLLHSGSFLPGALAGYHADTVFLCTPGIPRLSPARQKQYFQEVITNTGANRVIPVHWDDFFLPLDEPLIALPRFAEDLDIAMNILITKSKEGRGFKLEMLPVWQKVPLFTRF